MSYILDALKKSERERTLVRGVGFADAARRVVQGTDWLPWLIGGIALLAVSLVATVFVMRGRLVPTEAVRAVAETPAPVVPQVVEAPSPAASVQSAPRTVAPGLAEQAPAATPLTEANVEAPLPVAPAEREAKFFADMPPEFQQSVPAIAVNIHVYAPEESQRILYINNQQYYRGDEVTGGVTVEEIVPEGVVLRFRGLRFKLPRPS